MYPLASAALGAIVAAAVLWQTGRATAPAAPDWPVHFVDRAVEAGLTEPTVYGGVDRKRFIIETNGAGVALIDVDQDGWLDVITLSGTRLEEGTRREAVYRGAARPTTRLYRNLRNGRFSDITAGSGLDREVGWSSGICVGDYDNDGRLDLFITAYGTDRLFRNLGGGRFADVTAAMGLGGQPRRWGSGCSFLDYDNDGRLDLFVATYLVFDLATAPEPGAGANCRWKGVAVNCGPKGLPTGTHRLYRNTGTAMQDVSAISGIGAVTGRYAMTAAAADLDDDGDVDLYVASDSTAAIFYRNNGDGTFTDIAVESGAAYNSLGAPQAGMGLALADVDGSGTLDILKTHFADDIPALYLNAGRGVFDDVAMPRGLGVENRFVQWGAGLPDLDNDGWPDILYVTGHVYPEVESQLPDAPHRSPRVVFRNLGGGRFALASAHSGPAIQAAHSSRGAAFGDIDNDGDIDVLVMNMNAPPSLLINEARPTGHWIGLRLRGTRANRAGLGSTVRVVSGGRTQARAVLSQSSYYSHDDLTVRVGLGDATRAERVEVRWPGGAVTVRQNLGANRIHVVTEDQTR